MPVLKLSTPGVYVQEISTLPSSVAEVETAIPAFIGYTEKADYLAAGDLIWIPTKISSLSEYTLYFGKPQAETNDSIAINVTDDGSGNYGVTATPDAAKQSKYNLAYAIQHYFDNGGGPCYIVSVGDYKAGTISKDDLIKGLGYVKDVDEVTLLSIPEAPVSDGYATVVGQMIAQAATLKDRFALIDPHTVTLKDQTNPEGKIDSDALDIRNAAAGGVEYTRYAAAYYPNLTTAYGRQFNFDDLKIDNTAPGTSPALKDKTLAQIGNGSALYGKIKTEIGKLRVVLPPSPAIAGLYARVDKNKGVWKAPANESLFSVVGPTVPISDAQQQNLNIDPNTGKSVNAIRTFPGFGTLVWGARTLNGNDNEWRYISVRRFFNMVEESVKKSSQWAVFEPNTIDTWVKMRAMVENYLFLKWREGALAGAKPEQAFFVKVGLGTTMTALDILEGRMNVEIGMAVARPAEFIILKFSQLVQQS